MGSADSQDNRVLYWYFGKPFGSTSKSQVRLVYKAQLKMFYTDQHTLMDIGNKGSV